MREFWFVFWKNLKSLLKAYFALGSFIGSIFLLIYVCEILAALIGLVATMIAMGIFVTIIGVLVNTFFEIRWGKRGYR